MEEVLLLLEEVELARYSLKMERASREHSS